MSNTQFPITAKFCYLALGFIRDQNEAMGVFPPFAVQMGLLGVAATLEAETMQEIADEVEFGKLQMESIVEARKLVDGLVTLSQQVEDEKSLTTILSAAKTIQAQAEGTLWKLSKIEA